MFIYILSILSLINMNASISFKTTTLRVLYVENSILGQLEFGTFFYICTIVYVRIGPKYTYMYACGFMSLTYIDDTSC